MTEQSLRAKCKRNGLVMKKSRRGLSLDNQGHFMIIEADRNLILAGERYDMTLKDVEAFLKEYLADS